jgi:hypothetical protein
MDVEVRVVAAVAVVVAEVVAAVDVVVVIKTKETSSACLLKNEPI